MIVPKFNYQYPINIKLSSNVNSRKIEEMQSSQSALLINNNSFQIPFLGNIKHRRVLGNIRPRKPLTEEEKLKYELYDRQRRDLFRQYIQLKAELGPNNKEVRDLENRIAVNDVSMVKHKSYSYQVLFPGYDKSEIESAAFFGYIKAIRHYNPDRVDFSAYARRVIENEILMYLRKSKSFNDIPLSSVIADDGTILVDVDDDFLNTSSYLIDPTSRIDKSNMNAAFMAKVIRIVNSMPIKQKIVVIKRLGLDRKPVMSQKELAEKFGCDQSYISRLEHNGRHQLREAFGVKINMPSNKITVENDLVE